MTIDREKLLGDGLTNGLRDGVDVQDELGETQRALREVTLMIEQSQG